MDVKKGYPLPLGVSERDGFYNFSVAVPSGKKCILKLYKKGMQTPELEIELLEEAAVGTVRHVAVPKAKAKGMEYHYEIDGRVYVDPYAKSVIEEQDKCVRGKVSVPSYDWEGDKPLEIPYSDVIAYSLHVKGFTKHSSSKVKKKGTFAGVVEKIPYLKELGINQIQCMPVYSFCEAVQYKNYWGYGEAFCFAVKQAYAAGKDAEHELKDMIKTCHKAGIEVVLNLPFTQHVPKQLIVDCLRYYVLEYHVDGFILNPYVAPMDSVLTDPVLSKTKILKNNDDFQNVMRQFLKGDKGMVERVIKSLAQQTCAGESCNYITNHTGFTLADLVSYNEKHNEANGENNNDGPEENYSWNCGVEGATKKKAVQELRDRQIRNALFLLMMAKGTPCLLAGDEFGNSQDGNNNVYCQDNELAWLDWRNLAKDDTLFTYVKELIAFRKSYAFVRGERFVGGEASHYNASELYGSNWQESGIPFVSYHGGEAWKAPIEKASRQLGVYYHDDKGTISDCYIAYNMHWEEKTFALPTLPQDKKWHSVFSTGEVDEMWQETLVKEQKEVTVEGRTIVMFVGKEK